MMVSGWKDYNGKVVPPILSIISNESAAEIQVSSTTYNIFWENSTVYVHIYIEIDE